MRHSEFLTPLDVELVVGSDSHWMITSPFSYRSDFLGRVITVPVGFITDFASIPRLPFMFMLMGDTAHEPAVIHDYLYYTGEVSRADADHVLHEAAGVAGLNSPETALLYLGVRVGGWMAWNDHKRERDVREKVA